MPRVIGPDDQNAPLERRRSSLAKSTASLQSKLAGLKLNKVKAKRLNSDSRKSSENEDASGHAVKAFVASQRSAAQLLVALPSELALQILSLLDLPSLFALRSASAPLSSLVYLHEYDLARQYLRRLPSYRRCISPFNSDPYTLRSLYRVYHAHATATSLAGCLVDFVETEILRLSSRRARIAFAPDHTRLVSRMTPQLLVLSHFFETWRHWMLQKYPKDENRGWRGYQTTPDHLSSPNRRDILPSDTVSGAEEDVSPKINAKVVMRMSYSHKQLRDASQMCNFLSRVLHRMLRPPTYATTVEKTLRGWNGKPPRVEYLDALLAIGGLDEARKLLSFKSLSARSAEVDRWVQGLHKADCVRWKENWLRLVYGPFHLREEDEEVASFEPPEHFSPEGFGDVWNGPSIEVLGEIDSSESWHPKTDRQFLSEMLGRDLLSGTRWQTDFDFDDDDDEGVESE